VAAYRAPDHRRSALLQMYFRSSCPWQKSVTKN
jgi:hypothetical protein